MGQAWQCGIMEEGNCAVSLESQQIPLNPSLEIVSAGPKFRFNKENAAEMQRRSWESRRKKAALALANKHLPPASPEKTPTCDPYVLNRIVQTRAQIEALDVKLARCKEAKEIKFLAESIAKLAELERVLSGRPLPGMFRPVKGSKGESQRDKRQLQGPLDAQE